MRHGFIRALGLVVAMAVTAYLAACAYLFVFQRDYLFKPGGTLATPAESGLEGVRTVEMKARDGTVLIGWFAAAGAGKPTILYFHGNAGNFAERSPRFRQIVDSGFGLMAMSYRGFAGSGGSPSETALFSDALEIFDWLAERTELIVVHGESLGTGIATYVAAERPARALILEAPFTAALDVAAASYPWVPTSLLMRDPFLSREHIARVEEPVLIAHGTADVVIPVEYGRRLFEAASQPKELVIFEGAGHSDLWKRGLWANVLDFLETTGVTAQPEAEVRRMPSLAG